MRARRKELHLTQDEVARRSWTVGVAFTRSVVDAVERGTRELALPEFAALLAVLGMKLEDLQGSGLVALDRGISVDGDTLVGQLLGTQGTWSVVMGSTSAVVNPSSGTAAAYGPRSGLQRIVGAYSDAELKAARKLGVTPDAVATAAETLWDRPLAEERDARVRDQVAKDASVRTLQALRGHVTRALLEELGPALKPPSRRTKGRTR